MELKITQSTHPLPIYPIGPVDAIKEWEGMSKSGDVDPGGPVPPGKGLYAFVWLQGAAMLIGVKPGTLASFYTHATWMHGPDTLTIRPILSFGD